MICFRPTIQDNNTPTVYANMTLRHIGYLTKQIAFPLSTMLRLFIAISVFFIFSPDMSFALLGIPVPDSDMGSLKKGTRFVGLSMNLKSMDAENPSSIFANIEQVDQSRYKINTYGGYFIKDLFALGGKWQYDYTKNDNSLTDNEISRIQVVKQYNTVGFIMRNYLPIDESGRFSLFVETGVDFGYGKEVKQETLENDIDRTVSHNYILDIGVTPGIMAFIDEGVAVEASVNVLGWKSEWGKYDFNNGERKGSTSSTELDFTVNLLSLFIGVTYYF